MPERSPAHIVSVQPSFVAANAYRHPGEREFYADYEAEHEYVRSALGDLVWTPDGEALLYAVARGEESYELLRYDLKTSDIRVLLDSDKPIYELRWSPDDRWLLIDFAYQGETGPADWHLERLSSDGQHRAVVVEETLPHFWKERVVGWRSPTEAILVAEGFERWTSQIRLVNVESLESRVLDTGERNERVLYIPSVDAILVSREIGLSGRPRDNGGVYEFDLASKNLRPIISSRTLSRAQVLGDLPYIAVAYEGREGLALYDLEGRVVMHLTTILTIETPPSGDYLVVHDDRALRILDPGLNEVASYRTDGHPVLCCEWLAPPDEFLARWVEEGSESEEMVTVVARRTADGWAWTRGVAPRDEHISVINP